MPNWLDKLLEGLPFGLQIPFILLSLTGMCVWIWNKITETRKLKLEALKLAAQARKVEPQSTGQLGNSNESESTKGTISNHAEEGQLLDPSNPIAFKQELEQYRTLLARKSQEEEQERKKKIQEVLVKGYAKGKFGLVRAAIWAVAMAVGSIAISLGVIYLMCISTVDGMMSNWKSTTPVGVAFLALFALAISAATHQRIKDTIQARHLVQALWGEVNKKGKSSGESVV